MDDRQYSLTIFVENYGSYLEWIVNEIARNGFLITCHDVNYHLANLEQGTVITFTKMKLVKFLIEKFKEKWDFKATDGPFIDAIDYICKNPKEMIVKLDTHWECDK